jgi:hypothetical protein
MNLIYRLIVVKEQQLKLIVFAQESPLHNRIDPPSVRGRLNWTFTYRSESTISGQYFPEFLPISANIPLRYHFRDDPYYMRTPQPGASHSTINYAHGKNKKVAWFVSNCYGHNGRGNYASELGRFVGFQSNLLHSRIIPIAHSFFWKNFKQVVFLKGIL